MCSDATQSFNCRNAVHASSSFVFAGKSACNWGCEFLALITVGRKLLAGRRTFLDPTNWVVRLRPQAFAAARNANAAIRPAMIHLVLIVIPSLAIFSKSIAWQAQVKGWSFLGSGCSIAALTFPSRRFSQRNFEDFAGRYSPNPSLLPIGPVLQFGGPVLFRDCSLHFTA